MEWRIDNAAIDGGRFVGIGGEGEEERMAEGALGLVNVMTEEQIEALRVQISAYAAICEGLVAMHSAVSMAQLAGKSTMSSVYSDPLMASKGPKVSSRQRWTPTPVQLQILERMFSQGIGTPSKQSIKDITNQLSLHGQISEANVFNWFQNKRARLKRKMQNIPNRNRIRRPQTQI